MLYVTLDNINNGFLMHNEVSNLKYCYLAHFASFKSWTKIYNVQKKYSKLLTYRYNNYRSV